MMGTIRMHKGQRYFVADTFTRQRAGGTLAVVLVWASNCADCGAKFEFSTPAASSKWEPNRRCDQHKRPGVRVGGVVA